MRARARFSCQDPSSAGCIQASPVVMQLGGSFLLRAGFERVQSRATGPCARRASGSAETRQSLGVQAGPEPSASLPSPH